MHCMLQYNYFNVDVDVDDLYPVARLRASRRSSPMGSRSNTITYTPSASQPALWPMTSTTKVR